MAPEPIIFVFKIIVITLAPQDFKKHTIFIWKILIVGP